MESELIKKERQLQSQLRDLQEQKQVQAEKEGRQKNYDDWLNRKPAWLLGKAYCAPTHNNYGESVMRKLGVSITVPGNCSYTYEVSDAVPAAVVVYFHNVFTNEMRSELQNSINKSVEKVVDQFLNNPVCVLEMLGLQSDDYYMKRSNLYPNDLIKGMEEEIDEERFKVLDRFKEEELLGISDKLSHSRGILFSYAKNRRLKKLISEISSKYDWAK